MVISDTYLLIISLIWLLKPVVYLSNTYFYEHYFVENTERTLYKDNVFSITGHKSAMRWTYRYSMAESRSRGVRVESRVGMPSFPGCLLCVKSMYITAAARGASRHDQRKIVWGVCDERRSKHLPRLYTYTCTTVQYIIHVYVYRRGRSKKRSRSAFQNRTTAHPDKKHVDRPTHTHTHAQTDFLARDI